MPLSPQIWKIYSYCLNRLSTRFCLCSLCNFFNAYIHLAGFHRFFRLSSLFFIVFSFCSSDYNLLFILLFLLLDDVCSWTPLVNISVQLLYSSAPVFLFCSLSFQSLGWISHFIHLLFYWPHIVMYLCCNLSHWSLRWLLWLPSQVIHRSPFLLGWLLNICFLPLCHGFFLILHAICRFALLSVNWSIRYFSQSLWVSLDWERPSSISCAPYETRSGLTPTGVYHKVDDKYIFSSLSLSTEKRLSHTEQM